MGSTCAGSLALMDAGVPVSKAVSGIAMGLVTGEDGSYTILTDIEGLEDAYGDMDFKVAGTKDGVTALQMDIKIKGITLDMVDKIIAQSHDARMLILDKMNQALSAPRPEMSKYAPRMYKIQINPEKIGTVIGTGGKTIRSIIEETKTDIDIQDDGTVIIGSPDAAAAQKAIEIIENMTKEVEVGSIYTGKVSRLFDFGAMVEFLPGREGLVHISELADYRVGKVEDVVKVGDEVMVKVVGIDNQGRINLSRRATFEKISGLHGAGEKDAHAGPPRQDTREPRRPFPFRDRRDSSDRPPRRDRPL
jgi:polyribonucleotide nucleotidyltransferase